MVQRTAHHLTRTLTRFHWLRNNNTKNKGNTAAIVHHATRGIDSAPCAIMTASRNNKALAGAGIVALGAGAFLCARAYSRARVADSSKKPLPSSVRVADAVVNAALPRETQARAKTPEPQTTSTSGPCEGCDCGMMEPGPLEGTMHAYERHVIICSGQEDWPKVIEAEESSLAESMNNMCLGAGLIWTKKVAKEAEANKTAASKNRVKITACAEPSRGPEGTTDVIVYPEGLVYSLPQHDMSSLERFVKVQLVDGLVARELKPVAVPYGKMVLVCTHMSRDKRCGRAGPQVLEEMSKELEARGVSSDQVALRGSSHFGGHRFAGVLIIYPQGDWYGLVNKKNAAAIIDKCVLGTEGMKTNWRGNMANPGTKAETPAKAAPESSPDTPTNAKPESESASVSGAVAASGPSRDSQRGDGA